MRAPAVAQPSAGSPPMVELGNSGLAVANAGLRLLLEVAALGVFGYLGYTLGRTEVVRLALGVGFPLGVAVVWGVFGSPAAPYRLGQPWRLGLETLILGGAAVGLYLLDRPALALGFAAVAALNTLLLYVLGQS